ncbi:MAG: porin family protein [Gammaproteobacteria bacterium]
MKKIVTLCASAIAFAAFATPASAAAPNGGRIEAIVGYDNVSFDLGAGVDADTSGVTYGVGAGYDFAVSPSVAIGIDLEAADSTADFEAGTDRVAAGRDLYAGLRLTTAVSDKANLYFKAGYTNARLKVETAGLTDAANGDGVRAGVGVQLAVSENAYIGGEYRYSNYEADITRHQGVLTIGFRM